ncbi:hypothetical protein F5X68DRAFT_238449 [Plectosphaerella plurivora]|uniref:Uncharacterized protein n=1 Tax=Plectosphaerella plurivora TaxID=936078 RepID=A0A9P8VMD3_9PEZI|nr:hypothetical protein F5X68DRAFT_238449 [Plectosphaerella plurivora]
MSRRSSSVGRRPSVNVHPPDLVIGIDFGMTGTAVAYASGLDKEVKVLKSWQDASNDCDKVPTAVAYKGDELVGWGFGVRDQENTAVVVKAFKGVIDQRVLAHFKTQNPHLDNQMTRYDTTAWLQDYLEQLRKHLESRLQSALPQGMSWDQSEILYLFSYPATWDHDTQSTFKKTIGKAGFDASGPHRIKVTMNEAKAAVASVFANKTLPSPGEHLIVVDIGGGMSDVGVFAVQPDKDKGPIPHLEPKFHECGINIGSSKIDEVFENKVKERLKPAIRKMVAKDVADTTVEALAAAAIRKVSGHESYLAAKHGYGGPKGSHLVRPDFPVPDAALIGDQNWKESICPLFFNKDELFGPAYESQCKEIWKLLLVCMKTLDSKDPAKGGDNDTLDLPSLKEKKLRIVLSGGMGKSPYVQDFLRKKLSELRIETPLDVADKPQLVVCRGLVESELRHLRDEDIWMYRAKVSYGVILRRAGGQEVSTTIVVSKDAQVETRQIIKVQIRIPTDDYETCELYLAQFPDHSVPRRYSFTRPNYGTARIVGPVLSSNHTGRPPVEAEIQG